MKQTVQDITTLVLNVMLDEVVNAHVDVDVSFKPLSTCIAVNMKSISKVGITLR